jgi:hypothetical protein
MAGNRNKVMRVINNAQRLSIMPFLPISRERNYMGKIGEIANIDNPNPILITLTSSGGVRKH